MGFLRRQAPTKPTNINVNVSNVSAINIDIIFMPQFGQLSLILSPERLSHEEMKITVVYVNTAAMSYKNSKQHFWIPCNV